MVKELIDSLNGVLLGKSETVELLVMALLADEVVKVKVVYPKNVLIELKQE